MSKYMDIRVIGLTEHELGEFLRVLGAIQHCGNTGKSRRIPIEVDGDGSGGLQFQILSIPPGTQNGYTPVNSFPEEQWVQKDGEMTINNLSIGE